MNSVWSVSIIKERTAHDDRCWEVQVLVCENESLVFSQGHTWRFMGRLSVVQQYPNLGAFGPFIVGSLRVPPPIAIRKPPSRDCYWEVGVCEGSGVG